MEVNFASKAPSLAGPEKPAIETQAEVVSQTPAAATPAAAPVASVPAAAPVDASTVVAATQSLTRATPQPLAQTNILLGDRLPDFKDIILPRLNITQNIGDLKDSFETGSIIFNQASLLFSPQKVDKNSVVVKQGTSPLRIVCLGFRPTRFVEKVAGGGRGIIVNTEAEVRANGGTLDYNEWNLKKADGMKRFEELAEALLAIERPEHVADDDTIFCYPVDGKKYALALYGMKGTAYTAAAKRVFFTNRLTGFLRGGYPTYYLRMATREQSYTGGNKAWVPVLTPDGKTSEGFLAWVNTVLNPQPAGAAGTDEAAGQ